MMNLTRILCIILGITFELLRKTDALHIAVIGGGVTGISSAKNAIDKGHTVEIFEKSEALGGAWRYNEKVGKNIHNVDIHSPLFKGYRTIMPIQVLEFPDNPYPDKSPSYPSHKIVWDYLKQYAEKNNLTSHIKYHHLVEKVLSLENDQWQITVKHLASNDSFTGIFDSVFVCTGGSSSPYIPKIPGAENFKGKVIHSHDYGEPETFQNEEVLVIGIDLIRHDIINELCSYSTKVTNAKFTNDSPLKKMFDKAQEILFNCFTAKHDRINSISNNVKRFTGPYEIEFENGTRTNFTAIIYATGYTHSYPFLDANVGIQVKNDHVEPLYMQVLNIEHHTMAFIGLPKSELLFRMYDLQARFALEFVSGAKELPPNLKTMEAMQKKFIRSPQCNKVQSSFSSHQDYFFELAQTAQIPNIRTVYSELYADALKHTGEPGYRNYNYVVRGNEFYRELDEDK